MPKISLEILAIPLTQELIGDVGQVLLVYPDDTLRVIDGEVAEAMGVSNGNGIPEHPIPPPPDPTKHYSRHAPYTKSRQQKYLRPQDRVFFTIRGKEYSMTNGAYKVLEAMASWHRPQKIANLNNNGQASFLRKMGYVANNSYDHSWMLTSKGRAVVDHVTAARRAKLEAQLPTPCKSPDLLASTARVSEVPMSS
jgi:hypothetical protein